MFFVPSVGQPKSLPRSLQKSRQSFLLFQWSLAARVVRDAPETPTAAEGAEQKFDLNEALNSFTQGLQKVLSKDNVDVSDFLQMPLHRAIM